MSTPFVLLLILMFMLAAMLAAYDTGRSAGAPECPVCDHCRDRRREAEERARLESERLARLTDGIGRRAGAPAVPAEGGGGAGPTAGAGDRGALDRILVAYDGSESARRALSLGVDLAVGLHATLAVVSVVPLHPGRVPIDPLDDRAVHARELREAHAFAAGRGVEVELVEPLGEPGPAIEGTAEAGEFDLVVVGAGQPRGWLPSLRSRVSDHLVAHGRRTVVVVR